MELNCEKFESSTYRTSEITFRQSNHCAINFAIVCAFAILFVMLEFILLEWFRLIMHRCHSIIM